MRCASVGGRVAPWCDRVWVGRAGVISTACRRYAVDGSVGDAPVVVNSRSASESAEREERSRPPDLEPRRGSVVVADLQFLSFMITTEHLRSSSTNFLIFPTLSLSEAERGV